MLSPCDITLVEGYKTAPIPKLEVWRAEIGKPVLYPRDPRILAIATDSPEALPASSQAHPPVLPLGDSDAIATFVVGHAIARPRRR
jgi:molybdopterin-guanine dinucleotide biosynthesis protein B